MVLFKKFPSSWLLRERAGPRGLQCWDLKNVQGPTDRKGSVSAELVGLVVLMVPRSLRTISLTCSGV